MSGMIQGGWEFVWASYGITGAVMLVYMASLWVRRSDKDSSE